MLYIIIINLLTQCFPNILCCRLLGKQLLRMRCSCSKTRSGTEFSANTIFKATIRASVYVKIVDRSISMSDDMVTARDNESRY